MAEVARKSFERSAATMKVLSLHRGNVLWWMRFIGMSWPDSNYLPVKLACRWLQLCLNSTLCHKNRMMSLCKKHDWWYRWRFSCSLSQCYILYSNQDVHNINSIPYVHIRQIRQKADRGRNPYLLRIVRRSILLLHLFQNITLFKGGPSLSLQQ